MRAEDLFEAIGALDEQILAQSEEDALRARQAREAGHLQDAGKTGVSVAHAEAKAGASGAHAGEKTAGRQGAGKKRRRKTGDSYRLAVIALTAAAAMFVVLMAKDLVGGRSGSKAHSAAEQYAESAAEEAVDETQGLLASGAGAGEDAGADTASPDKAAPAAGSAQADGTLQSRSSADSAQADAAGDTQAKAAGGAQEGAAGNARANAADGTQEGGNAQANAAGGTPSNAAGDTQADAFGGGQSGAAEGTPTGAAEGAQAQDGAEERESGKDTGIARKAAVDMLGEFRGDYVKMEYISAEDAANGGARKEPEYSEEGEAALSTALNGGKKRAKMFANLGEPVYYVYLTDDNGDVDTVTFYENRYVSINTIPGVVLELSEPMYEGVLSFFD